MDMKAIYSLSYGVFLLTTKCGDIENGCITNTCMQVANDPTRVAFSVIKANYTCELISKSGLCTLSILDKSVSFDTIKHFGMQSGRSVDKMKNMNLPKDDNDIKYLNEGACAILSLRVVDSMDMGSHVLFIAEVTKAMCLGDNEPITYAEYHKNLKEKRKDSTNKKKIVGYRCTICNYEYEGEEIPSDFICPLCGHDIRDFEPIYE